MNILGIQSSISLLFNLFSLQLQQLHDNTFIYM